MSKNLKKMQWILVIQALIFLFFACKSVYDSLLMLKEWPEMIIEITSMTIFGSSVFVVLSFIGFVLCFLIQKKSLQFLYLGMSSLVIFVMFSLYFQRFHRRDFTFVSSRSPLMYSDSRVRTLEIKKLDRDEVHTLSRGTLVQYERENDMAVSRVIGLPNETVSMKNSIIYINAEPLSEPYAIYDEDENPFNFSEMKVPENTYLLMGDNRSSIGPVRILVRFEKIKAVVTRTVTK